MNSNPKPSLLAREKSILLTIIFAILLFNIEEYFFNGHITFSLFYAFADPTTLTGGITRIGSPLEGTFIIGTLILTGVIFWISFTSDNKSKWLYFALFAVAMMIQFGYWKAINRHFNFQDFFTNVNSPRHLWLFSLQAFFNPWGFLTIPIYGFFLFYIKPDKPKKFLPSFSAITGLVILMAITAYLFNQTNHVTFASSSFYRSMTQAAFAKSDQEGAVREAVQSPENGTTPDKNILFIVDESIKHSHMSLYGYERDTTPTLRKLHEEGKIILWDDAIATTSCSVMSNATLISGVNSVPDTDRRVYKNPTIFQYAKAMGYTTHYYDGQFS